MKKLVQTIDLTPTWPEALNVYLQALNTPFNGQGRQIAIDGLRKMAEVAQQYVEMTKEEKKQPKQTGDKKITAAALRKALRKTHPNALVRFAVQAVNKKYPSVYLTVDDTFERDGYQFWIHESEREITIRLHLPDNIGFVDRRPKKERT